MPGTFGAPGEVFGAVGGTFGDLSGSGVAPTYVGGLRARLIRASVFRTVNDALAALGWFTPAASHAPITFRSEPEALDVEVPPNTLALADETITPADAELGSNLTEFTWPMFVDVYGEDDAVSLHLAGDLEAILAGRMPSIGRADNSIAVWDYTLATPALIFGVEVLNVHVHRAHDFPQPWLRFWRSVTFDIVDAYGDEGG